jgi:hypothetical protein
MMIEYCFLFFLFVRDHNHLNHVIILMVDFISEPQTNGLVVIHTTSGDISIELWSKEAPRTCKNFIVHALVGYYDSTEFHRVCVYFF